MPLTIWTDIELSPHARMRLETALGAHRLLDARPQESSGLKTAASDPRLAEADIALGQPNATDCLRSARLKWVSVSSAGYTRYDRPEVLEELRARGALLTTMSSVFAEPCAQHVLAMMLALGRRLPESVAAQLGAREWQRHARRSTSVLLNGQTVLLLGYGAIARRLVELLRPFDMQVFAVRRRAYSESGVHIISEERVTTVLREADHVINLLPDNEATQNYVNARRLAACKPTARFYNVGRGTTVDHLALAAALESGQLDAAYLDVFPTEPLSPGDRLWTLPNCWITPHSAGGRQDQSEAMVDHFLTNFAAFTAGQFDAMIDRVGRGAC